MRYKPDKAHQAKSKPKTSREIRGLKFSGVELREKVLAECRREFEALTKQPWSDDRAKRIARELEGAPRDNEAEALAYAILRRLFSVLDEVTAFTGVAPPDADGHFPRLPYVSGGYGAARFLHEWAGRYHLQVQRSLDPVREVVKDDAPEREDTLTSFLARFGDHLWPRTRDERGLASPPPGPRELAILSLLAGAELPAAPPRTTVADILERQTKKIREAMRRASAAAERLENSAEMQERSDATGISPAALALVGPYRNFGGDSSASKAKHIEKQAPLDAEDEGDTHD